MEQGEALLIDDSLLGHGCDLPPARHISAHSQLVYSGNATPKCGGNLSSSQVNGVVGKMPGDFRRG